MERQPVHRFSQIFLKLVVNEVNIGAYLDDVLVYVNFGNNKQAVRRFRVIDRAIEQPLAQVSLRVKVNAQHTFAVAQTETDSQILRDSSFTSAAFLIDKGEDPGLFFLYRGDRDIALKSLRPKRGKCLFSHISGSLTLAMGEPREMLQTGHSGGEIKSIDSGGGDFNAIIVRIVATATKVTGSAALTS